ncbi:MAG: DUF309 domain-containing protein [Armatimonadetes bacterium]|nr:DUF309 domain-containing protein [Armatimonadota bacterium]
MYEPPLPEFLEAACQFNRREFFECHETLEGLWLKETGELRRFYQGLLQVGVGFYHLLERRNYHGAVRLLERGCANLRFFPPDCLGFDMARLTAEAESCHLKLLDLGPDRISEFDTGQIPILHPIASR